MKLVRAIGFYLIGIFAIICISIFPHFLTTTGLSNPFGYFHDFGQFIQSFGDPETWLYQSTAKSIYGENIVFQTSLLDIIWEPYIYSMQIFLGAILLGFALAFFFTFLTSLLPQTLMKGLQRLLDFLETVPDLVIAILLQIFSIYIYKASGLDIYRVAGLGDEKVFFAPIVTLAIFPMISLFRILLLRIEEENMKDYVGFLKSKGIHKVRILWRHVIRNVLPTAFHHSKVIIWGTLSSQFVIEYIFNVYGITWIIIDSFLPITIAVSLFLIFTPFYVSFQVVGYWLNEDQGIAQNILRDKKRTYKPWQSIKDWFQGMRNINWKKIKPWKPVISSCAVFLRHMKNYKFLIGMLFFVIVIGISVTYSITTDNHVDQATILYNEDGSIKSTPAHRPGTPFLLGSDNAGFDLLDKLVIGAKYTLFFGFLIAFLRVVIGLLGGIIFAFSLSGRKQNWFEKLVESIHFVPLTLIAYILLTPILYVSFYGESMYSLTERIIIEIVVLTVLVIPLTSVLIGNDIKQILKNDFITSAKVIGGSKFHILRRHVLPHLGPRMAILAGQQFIQVLFIFIHLGVFNLFFGGTVYGQDLVFSVSNEWSGLIGAAKNEIGENGDYWMALWPLLAFMLTIFAMQLIIKGVKDVQQAKIGISVKQHKKKLTSNENKDAEYWPTAESFQWVNKKTIN